jgi:ATP synthase protein I
MLRHDESGLEELKRRVRQQARRMQKAERDRPTLMGQTVYIGSLGILLVLPIVGGVYLGHWLDERSSGYSIHWTIGMLLLGLVIGIINVYLFIRE